MFDNNLKFARAELGMTQAELGFVFGVSDTAVRSWETAHDSMPLPKLIKFCDMYDFSLDFICGLDRRNIKNSELFFTILMFLINNKYS